MRHINYNKKFYNFCLKMHIENCRERRAYGEEEYSFEDYVKKQKSFLFEKYKDYQANE